MKKRLKLVDTPREFFFNCVVGIGVLILAHLFLDPPRSLVLYFQDTSNQMRWTCFLFFLGAWLLASGIAWFQKITRNYRKNDKE